MHLIDNLFRHLILYLIPIALFAVVGLVLAQRSAPEFTSDATLDASNNPLIEELDVRGDDALFRQSNADSTANFINERLRTESFSTEVANAAGLGNQLDAGLITNTTIRTQVSVAANGDSIVTVAGTWSDPTTAQNLAQATIDTYRNYVVDTVTEDSIAAEEFFTELLNRATDQRTIAEDQLNDYVVSLPPVLDGADRPVIETATIERLNSALERAEVNVELARSEIEAAQLEVAKSRSEAGLSIRLIDPPELPLSSEGQLIQIISLVAVFIILGILTSATALVITTALDNSVRFEFDVAHRTGNVHVASVRSLRRLRKGPRKRNKSRDGGNAVAITDDGPTDHSVVPKDVRGDNSASIADEAADSDPDESRDHDLDDKTLAKKDS